MKKRQRLFYLFLLYLYHLAYMLQHQILQVQEVHYARIVEMELYH